MVQLAAWFDGSMSNMFNGCTVRLQSGAAAAAAAAAATAGATAAAAAEAGAV